MRKCNFLGLSLITALILGAVACGGGGTTSPTATPTKSATQPTATKAAGSTPVGEIVNIKLSENPYSYAPTTFNFEVGKAYTLTFSKPAEFHTFTVQGLTYKEAIKATDTVDIFINIGEAIQQTITPTKAGTFKLFCLPHEGLDMVGKVIVK